MQVVCDGVNSLFADHTLVHREKKEWENGPYRQNGDWMKNVAKVVYKFFDLPGLSWLSRLTSAVFLKTSRSCSAMTTKTVWWLGLCVWVPRFSVLLLVRDGGCSRNGIWFLIWTVICLLLSWVRRDGGNLILSFLLR